MRNAWRAACVFAIATTSVATPALAAAKRIQCLSTRGGAKLESRCANIDLVDRTRTYRVYAPTGSNTTGDRTALPVVIALHGGNGSGGGMEQMTKGQFNRLADRHRFIVAYPDGVDRRWNDGSSDGRTQPKRDDVDDIGFLRAMISDIERRTPIDRKRVYATGIADGGLMSFRLACDASDFVAAIAPVAANLPVELVEDCRPTRIPSIMIVNGTDDPIMPWLGGEIKALWSRGDVLSAQESFERWLEMGDCANPTTHNQSNKKAADGTALIRHFARECKDGAEIRLYEIAGGGHTWPGGEQYLSARVVGAVSRALNASDEIWNFFATKKLR